MALCLILIVALILAIVLVVNLVQTMDLVSCPCSSSGRTNCSVCSSTSGSKCGHGSSSVSRHVPQGNRLDLVELDLPLQNLLDLTLIWTLLHLLTSNQVQELRSEDEITLYSLRNNRKSQTGSGSSAVVAKLTNISVTQTKQSWLTEPSYEPHPQPQVNGLPVHSDP